MLFFMFSFLLLSSLCSGLSPAGLLHAGERSELRAAAPQETMAHLMQGLLSPLILRLFKSWLCPAFPLSLLRQGKQTGAPAQETPVACASSRSEEHTSELQSRLHLVCRLLLEKKKK